MMYLWPQGSSMKSFHKNFGVMTSCQHRGIPLGIQEGRKFGVDNNAYTTGFIPDKFFSYLEKLTPYMDNCLFIACPDVVGDSRATIKLWDEWVDKIGKPIAFIAQDGQECLPFPDYDWMFIGGTTEWKMGDGAKKCILRAQEIDKPVHVGRVNSLSRFRYFQRLGVYSVDGTSPCFAPDYYKRRYTNAVSQLDFHNALFGGDSFS